MNRKRCRWCLSDPLYIQYHDEEWGYPVHEDRRLFEKLCLEGFQAGLSWLTILRKRERFRAVFEGFEAERLIRFSERDKELLLQDRGIIRNRLKIEAVLHNAQQFLNIQQEFGSFDRYLWQFTGYRTLVHYPRSNADIPTRTAASDLMAKDLKKRGFRFVGTTICYAFMQSMGMVDDHTTWCWRKQPVEDPQ